VRRAAPATSTSPAAISAQARGSGTPDTPLTVIVSKARPDWKLPSIQLTTPNSRVAALNAEIDPPRADRRRR